MDIEPQQPQMLTPENARTWGILAHLSAAAGLVFPFGNVLAPLAIWLIMRERSEFVDRHGRAAVNFQISVTIYMLVSLPLMFVVIGFITAAFVAIFTVVMVIVSAVAASNGRDPGYALAIPFIR